MTCNTSIWTRDSCVGRVNDGSCSKRFRRASCDSFIGPGMYCSNNIKFFSSGAVPCHRAGGRRW